MGASHDLSSVPQRTVITGNGGSGKTWLATRLAQHLGLSPVHLDDIHWESGRYGIARERHAVVEDVWKICTGESWLIEGVYGLYVDLALPRATMLIWLDVDDHECAANVKRRGIQGGESQEAFERLLQWISQYRFRTNNWNSYETHLRLYEGFRGAKARLRGRAEIDAYLQSVTAAQ